MTREPISIVVPVKNRATLVLRTLASIKAQTWRPLKVIVVDNGSTDGTPDSVKEWAEKNGEEDFGIELLSQPKPGASAARNMGLEAVDTRLMMFFDSDDLMKPGHVESIMQRFHEDDQPDMVFYRLLFHPINKGERTTKRAGSDLMVSHICHGVLCTAAMALETALARRAGGWDEDLRGWDDLEFGARTLMEARRRAFISPVNVEVFAQVESITGTEFSSHRGEWELALDRMEKAFETSRHRRREKWLRVLSYKRAILAAQYKREKNEEAAAEMMTRALSNPTLNPIRRLYLKLAYRYTAIGGRGAAIPLNLIM